MKKIIFLLWTAVLFVSCDSNNNPKEDTKNETSQSNGQTTNGTEDHAGNSGIVGEWEQTMSCFDKNGNSLLDPEERVPAELGLGFNYFQFNADGTCLRDSDLKLKGSYVLKDQGAKTKLEIHTEPMVETYTYQVLGALQDELILLASGAFMVFKRK
jgi:hypothetical protein